ncbi:MULTISPECIES: amino acid ABC transporter permease [Microbacterium]|uniref:amino acid ABC transporter permease n=1 Tax=Microbacterium TaxID=33882 RepID=UPI001E5B132F|nr:amino acid ABC transporter permease [Microbacterium nymphoidis]MCD2497209.1 amino acid ABC transporter permease [Microbacterium nymphoidis]MDR2294112.1 amino acid ABC transporter permease [Microbacterium sp.]
MAMTARQRRTVSRWIQVLIFVVAILLLVFLVNWPLVADSFFQFGKTLPMFPDIILVGLRNTLLYTITSFIFGLALGLVLALMKTASFPPYRWVATIYIEFFRGIPALLVLLALGYGLPLAFSGLKWDFWVTVMVALGLVSAAYMAETLRAGLQAVPKGQMEAARSLGMPQWRAMISIIIPQAFRIVLPPLTNELILLTKDTSLVQVLGMTALVVDLTKMGRDGMLSLGGGMTPLLVAGLFYLCITIPLTFLARWFEKRTAQVSRPKRQKKEVAA